MHLLKALFHNRRPFLALLIGAMVAQLLFVNCIDLNGKKDSISSSNGEGYGGMTARFGNRKLDSVCPDGKPYQSIIELHKASATAQILREDCLDIQPRTVSASDVSYLEHQQDHLIYRERVFDQLNQSGKSLYLCRGQGPDPATGKLAVVDAIIYVDDAQAALSYRGRVVLGVYGDSGQLESQHDTGEIPVRAHNGPGNQLTDNLIFEPLAADNPDRFLLNITLSTMSGVLTYLPSFRNIVIVQNDPQMLQPVTVGGLSCYSQ